mmetsp:Transcript_45401/g.135735  ORF Transcript_45401/g.135735 Transcript_45401/m.135735 type:complete len:268 (+) Transcript_45401:975-1778(+)
MPACLPACLPFLPACLPAWREICKAQRSLHIVGRRCHDRQLGSRTWAGAAILGPRCCATCPLPTDVSFQSRRLRIVDRRSHYGQLISKPSATAAALGLGCSQGPPACDGGLIPAKTAWRAAGGKGSSAASRAARQRARISCTRPMCCAVSSPPSAAPPVVGGACPEGPSLGASPPDRSACFKRARTSCRPAEATTQGFGKEENCTAPRTSRVEAEALARPKLPRAMASWRRGLRGLRRKSWKLYLASMCVHRSAKNLERYSCSGPYE